MLSNVRLRTRHERGFTLIELLVVVLIIGILAVVAIPTFFTQEKKGRDAVAKSAARTAQTAMEACRIEHDSYADCALSDLEAIEPTLNDASVTLSGLDTNTYVIVSTASTGHTFTVTRHDDGSVTRDSSGSTW